LGTESELEASKETSSFHQAFLDFEAGGSKQRNEIFQGAAVHELESETFWMAQGNCHNHPPTAFFPPDGVGVERAKRVCVDCPVSATCLNYALQHRIDHGVWGGTSERERRRILKSRRLLLLST
jgi:WhiB family transcriptional regulator, redox-sensing transcriptional regulator